MAIVQGIVVEKIVGGEEFQKMAEKVHQLEAQLTDIQTQLHQDSDTTIRLLQIHTTKLDKCMDELASIQKGPDLGNA